MARTEDAGRHPALEEYLEALFVLEEEGVPPRQATLARRLGVSRAAVAEMASRLTASGWIRRAADRTLELTASGRKRARTVVRRHRLAERLLIDVLDLPWHLAHEEACRLEHAITPAVEARIEALLGRPATSPFGTRIPRGRSASRIDGAVPLSSLRAGERLEVRGIAEGAQLDRDLLRSLVAGGVRPGERGRVSAVGSGRIEVALAGGSLLVPTAAARHVLVRLERP